MTDSIIYLVLFVLIAISLMYYYEIWPLIKAKRQGFNLSNLEKGKLLVRCIALGVFVLFGILMVVRLFLNKFK